MKRDHIKQIDQAIKQLMDVRNEMMASKREAEEDVCVVREHQGQNICISKALHTCPLKPAPKSECCEKCNSTKDAQVHMYCPCHKRKCNDWLCNNRTENGEGHAFCACSVCHKREENVKDTLVGRLDDPTLIREAAELGAQDQNRVLRPSKEEKKRYNCCEKCGGPLVAFGLGRVFHECPRPSKPKIERLTELQFKASNAVWIIGRKINELIDRENNRA